jgi:alpha-N-arabinofuranosidase
MASIQLALLRHADRVKIGCMTGGLGALCASDHDHVWKSASFYPFTHLLEYAKGTALKTAVDSETFDIPGYAIDDNSQYPTKEGVPYIDAASAFDEENGRVAIFVININDKDEYPLSIDASGFEGYDSVSHVAMFTEDMDARNSFDNPDAIKPVNVDNVTLSDGIIKTYVKPLSWNVIVLEKRN